MNAIKGDARHQILVDEAKKEGGQLSLYHVNIEDIPAMAEAFTKKYGIKVKVWRSSSENVTRRIATESQAGRFDADIVDSNGPGLEALHREKLLQPVVSPYDADLIPQAFRPHREWVATTLDAFVAGYNPTKVKKEDLPKTYQDLLDPKWKGMLAVESEDQTWFAMILEKMGPEKGRKLFQDIVATNGIQVRKGHSLLANMVVSGEVPLALTLYQYKPEQLKKKGAAIDWFTLAPVIVQTRGIAMPKNAPRPYTAMLFYDFMLNEGQQIYASRLHHPMSKKFDGAKGTTNMVFLDPARAIDENEKWTQDYEKTITKAMK
jgi:iron(III) transport system substrate-binding protein